MPTYYNKPSVGQPMRFRASPTETIDGFVSTVKTIEGTVTRPDGTQTENWTALVTSGATSLAVLTYRSEVTPDSWMPVSEDGFVGVPAPPTYDDSGLVAAIEAAADSVAALGARVDALEASGQDMDALKAAVAQHNDSIQRLLRAAPAGTNSDIPRRR